MGLLAFAPDQQLLGLSGWVWPVLLTALVVRSLRGARRSLDNWSRRTLLYPALLVLLVIALGGAVGTVEAATASNPAPWSGRAYRVDGHRLYLNCVGSGSPAVVLFNGLGEWMPNGSWVQTNVSRTTRVCAFDRAGEGWSGGDAVRQDGHQLASDLHALLHAAHVPGPYVLAGHSVGGTYALVYAAQYPTQVAAVALIDSATPYQFDLSDYPAARAFNSSPRQLTASRTEFLQLPKVFAQAETLRSLHGKPLAVLSARVGAMRGWATAQNRLARLSTNSTHRTIAGAGHAALLEDKESAGGACRSDRSHAPVVA